MIAETQYYLVISSSSHLDWAFNVVKCVVDCFMQKNNKTVEKLQDSFIPAQRESSRWVLTNDMEKRILWDMFPSLLMILMVF